MNDPLKKLEQQLERATARGRCDDGELDPETAQLREAWTALDRLLTAVEPDSQSALGRWSRPPTSRPRRRFLLPAVALAASLVVGAAATWMWWGAGLPGGDAPQTARSDAGRAAPEPTVVTKAPANAVAPAASAHDPNPKWDDPLDEQLARLGQEVIRVEQDWGSQAVAHAVNQYQWDQARQDLSGSSL